MEFRMRLGCARGVVGAVVLVSLLNARPAHAERCTELPVMLIVQDKSNSMWGYPNSACTTANPCDSKWDIASTVVPDVAAEFTGGFRYAMSMYPGDGASSNSCSLTNLQQLAIGADAADIQQAFLDATPAGATPTADALRAAKSYLVSNNVAAPSYVLLVTDGLPNCNAALDPNSATCSCTVPRTGTPATCPSKRCLDDSGSRTAAAELAAAGYQVFVVGFGGEVSADNNVAVLNSIAQAGGTGQAYITDNATGLYNQLRAIINQVNNCCQDACALGDVECAPSETARNVCTVGAEGCNVWTTQPCGNGSLCNAVTEQCQACNTTCTAGATECLVNGSRRVCVADAQGCTSWRNETCPNGSQCSAGMCTSCTGACQAGATRCDGNGTQTCVVGPQGCTSWGPTNACFNGSVCNNGSCGVCNGTCVAGARECVDGSTSRICVADASGCTSWRNEACDPGESCGGGECASCNACTEGEVRCAGNLPQTCVADGQGCTSWQSADACGENQVCANGGCLGCSNGCEANTVRCNGNDVETCIVTPGSCNRWEPKNTCGAPEVCVNGACCINECTPGERRCGGTTDIQVCESTPAGCGQWHTTSTCGAGDICIDEVCKQACEISPEGDTNCPDGSECIMLPSGNYCEVFNPGGGGTSSSQGGYMGSRVDAGPVGGVGAGEKDEDDERASACGCEASSPSGMPLSSLLLAAGFLVVTRRRFRG